MRAGVLLLKEGRGRASFPIPGSARGGIFHGQSEGNKSERDGAFPISFPSGGVGAVFRLRRGMGRVRHAGDDVPADSRSLSPF